MVLVVSGEYLQTFKPLKLNKQCMNTLSKKVHSYDGYVCVNIHLTTPIRYLQHVTGVKAMITELCKTGIHKLGGDAWSINMSVNGLSRQCSCDPGRDVVHQSFQHIQRLTNLSVIKYPQAIQYT